jgi:hypothetical protein
LKPAIDIVYAGLKWLWDNVLVPLAEFLGSGFMAAINAVADALGWLAGVIGGAWDNFVETVAVATGQWENLVRASMEEQTSHRRRRNAKQIKNGQR